MAIKTYFAFLFSFFFLFILVAPTIVLLNSNEEVTTVVFSLEEENKDIEDVKEFIELVFDQTHTHNARLFITHQALSFMFYNKTLSEIHLENTSPPPEFI